VHGGDTLHGIAAAHNESTADLLAANRDVIDDPNVIHPGEELTVEGGDGAAAAGSDASSGGSSSYVVQSGDTLHEIANRYGVSTLELLNANRDVIDDPTLIYPGEHLALPGSASADSGQATSSSTPKHAADSQPKQAASNDTGSASGIVSQARQYLGVPYSWGGDSGSGMDCSGLVYRVMQDLGYDPPRTAAGQQDWATPISQSEAQPGDLVFWGDPAHHVGIYIGDGKMIDESVPGTSAHVQDLWGSYTFGQVP
jgi:cell wall-associated NlpC family hydrolase